jgi:D-alanyl-lipoteichoic acid acyltransferase DltB (MBOAT superfamily)
MIFNSLEFVLFFVIVYGLYVILTHRAQNWMLLAASYVFYAWWDWRFTILIFLTTFVDYHCARGIAGTQDPRRRKWFLTISMVTDLGILGFFKYFNFFTESAVELLDKVGFQADPITLQIILPVGISFYTFQSMSYTIDVYRGELQPAKSLANYALFVSFFPQLVAGPIERARHLLPQMENPRTIRYQDMREGAWLILFGFFKKVVVADNFAVIANEIFNNPGEYHGFAVLLGVYAFAWQIYGDFSGYSNIARGVARLMGVDIMVNFRMPYFASNPQEFWRRWHISLSTWLRDYLYISLGGNRYGSFATYRNLFLTMLLGGLWHGAAWNFVLWGAYQGGLLIVHRLYQSWRNISTNPIGLKRVLITIVFFQFVCFGWILFRVNAIADLPVIMASLFTPEFSHMGWVFDMLFLGWPLYLLHLYQEWKKDLYAVKRLPVLARFAVYMILWAYICACGKVDGFEFIYFQF